MTSWDKGPAAMIAGGGAGDQRRSCFCCGEFGHFARDCLHRVNRKLPGAAHACFACGGPGHFARDCPNKSTPNRTRNHPSRPNRTAGISRAGGTSAGRGEGGPNRMSAVGGEGGPNRTTGITRAAGSSAIGGEGVSNRTAGITRAGYMSAGGDEGGVNLTAGITGARYRSAGRGECGPNRTAGITRVGGMSTGGGEGGPNCTAGITRAGYRSAGGGEGGPNSIAGITRTGGLSADGGDAGPNPTAGIIRASGTGASGDEGGPNHKAGITRGVSAGGGHWIRRRELPADQSKGSASIHGGGIGGVPSLDQSSYFPPTLGQEYGGSGSLPYEPVNQTYHNVNWKYDTGKFFGSSGIVGGDNNKEYSNLLNISNGDCGKGSTGSSKDSGEGSSARGLLSNISSSSSDNDFDDDDYKDFDMCLSRTSLSEGRIMEKSCGFVVKVSDGLDGERSSNGKYTSGKSFNNNGTMSRGPAVIDISSSSSEDEEEGIVRKKTTSFLSPTGKVKEEIKRVVGDDDDDDCVILECNPFEPPTTDFEQKVSLSEHKSSIVHNEDITIISERGQVACRDYPHSRHHCAKFPFIKTPDESCCPQCYCYICEVVAPCKYWSGSPCKYWSGSRGHCHASDQDPVSVLAKEITRNLRLLKIPCSSER